MTTAPNLTPGVSVRATMADLVAGAHLPVWVRVGCIAWSLADGNGHAALWPGQLARALGTSAPGASNALARAREYGWVDESSTARCLVLPGCGARPCEERHRG